MREVREQQAMITPGHAVRAQGQPDMTHCYVRRLFPIIVSERSTDGAH